MATVENHGSIVLVRPDGDFEKEWLKENTDGQWWCGALVVEPRYVEQLLDGLYGNCED
jgi:hypothetical protein